MAKVNIMLCCFALFISEGLCIDRDIAVLKARNPDETDIERPCGAVYDVNCVRQFISQHAICKKTYGPVPDPLIRSQNNLDFPRVNLTVTLINQRTEGLNGRIDEFYINEETNNLVIAIQFANLTMSSNDTLLRIHRRAQEPNVTMASATFSYPSIIYTVVIPNIKKLQLDKAEYYAYVPEPPSQFNITPNSANSTDPQQQATLAGFMSGNPQPNVMEATLTDAAFYPATFIQYNICDFGLKIL